MKTAGLEWYQTLREREWTAGHFLRSIIKIGMNNNNFPYVYFNIFPYFLQIASSRQNTVYYDTGMVLTSGVNRVNMGVLKKNI